MMEPTSGGERIEVRRTALGDFEVVVDGERESLWPVLPSTPNAEHNARRRANALRRTR